MIAFLILFIHVVISPFKTKARLEAEIIMLRHQSSRRDHPVDPGSRRTAWLAGGRP